MSNLILTLLSLTICFTSSAQFVARMELKEPISGLCDDRNVYALIPGLKGQQEAISPVSDDVILERLNSEVKFLQNNPQYEDKGMIGLVINCKGQVVQCKMDNKTKNADLDTQIEAVFNSLGEWKPGKLNRKAVDTSRLFSFAVKNGKISFD